MAPKNISIKEIRRRDMDNEIQEGSMAFEAPISNMEFPSSRSIDINSLSQDDTTDHDYDDKSLTTAISRSSQVVNPNVVSRMRKCIVSLFVVLAVFTPVAVYIASRDGEYKQFVDAFNSFSDQIIFEFGNNLGTMMLGYDSLSIKATSHAIRTNSSWPFVTLPDMDFIGSSTISSTGTLAMTISHIVEGEQRQEWEEYVKNNINWIWEAMDREESMSMSSRRSEKRSLVDSIPILPNNTQGYNQEIFAFGPSAEIPVIVDPTDGPYLPIWQMYPLNNFSLNFNFYSGVEDPDNEERAIPLPGEHPFITPVQNLSSFSPEVAASQSAQYTAWLRRRTGDPNIEYQGEPISTLHYPIFDSFEKDRRLVAELSATIYWQSFFEGILPKVDDGAILICVIETGCGDVFTLGINGKNVEFLGHGDFHEEEFNYLEVDFEFSYVTETVRVQASNTLVSLDKEFCPYVLKMYPSDGLHAKHMTNIPLISALTTAAAFIIVAWTVASYDWIVRKRIRRVLKAERVTNAVLAAHFPGVVRDRLLGKKKNSQNNNDTIAHPKAQLKTFLDSAPSGGAERGQVGDLSFLQEAPIADLFLHCTVLFADISGFSAWSSERAPEQVFTLLETVFQTFDRLAHKRGVFKVETIADSYMAVTGLPSPQIDHAVRMTRFARDCLTKANEIVKFLEKILGPGTADLRFRFGLHSGQVTAGVLRGEKTRFQLFGDTVNTASRMESTGVGNRIHLSETTAAALTEAGKDHWIIRRLDPVNVKGKGLVTTYWTLHDAQEEKSLEHSTNVSGGKMSDANKATGSSNEKDLWGENEGNASFALPADSKTLKNQRLVDWLFIVLKSNLKQVIAQRRSKSQNFKKTTCPYPPMPESKNRIVIDEVVEAFIMPKFDWKQLKQRVDPESIELSPAVVAQLKDFVEGIMMKYHDNPFHNFEHASHVTMSAAKLLNRIVVPEDVDYKGSSVDQIMSIIHEYTFGITSDALAQFAVTFSCLIHDVDHRGVPNGQLEKETPELSKKYEHRSIAEQNSVDVAWNLLMQPRFKELREAIFVDENEESRFRKYVVNLVMATDIFEKQMKELRQERWRKAFAAETVSDSSDLDSVVSGQTRLQDAGAANLKATIVLEHIIQAADVSHTMQHWRVYKKWNEHLFNEMYLAYEQGRSEIDPSLGWYKGELWFFDYYVIPLARKLEECGVFGVSSDECLNYAIQNRSEWEEKGEMIVQEMVERYKKHQKL